MTTRRVLADVAAVLAVSTPASDTVQSDPVLAALAEAHVARETAEQRIRMLLAYAREFVYPHPYTLGELGAACGMSASGVRTAYTEGDIAGVADATGLQPSPAREDR
ncbi:hypothetical protein R8Z50_11225 [Longispora sp. K20-0274]|uniref:hypothetical protein n=1 Tax=Longispora sp. K20-0274 TaxID=3088255 RepID=UPI003999FCD7